MAAKVAIIATPDKENRSVQPAFLTVAVRVQPRARLARVGGASIDPAGRHRLHVSVTEPAEDGRATRAVLAAVAAALGLPASRVALQSGSKTREKLLRVEGDPAVLQTRLSVLLSG